MTNPIPEPIKCACGCGDFTTIYKGRCKKYITGHNSFVKNPFTGKTHSFESKAMMSAQRVGVRPANYKGGTKSERQMLMQRQDYIIWRTAVFMRDDYTCQTCNTRGGKLEADHIKPWSLYPDLRYAIDNGRTLCVSCHRQTDTWGGRVRFLK
jgi:hypothetical protein